MNPKARLIILSLVFLLSAPSFALAQSVPQLAQKALAATVSLEMQDENGNTLGQGSGFFVRRNLIATNFHVIDGAAKGYARLVNTATTYPIEGVTAANEANDLALLKVSAHGINPLDLGNSDAVQIGETVYVAGNPLGLEGTFSDGIISGRRGSFTKKERLQMTAPISPGSSGGPVLNRKGEVIGVSATRYDPLRGQNLNFAVPSKALKKLLHRSAEARPFSPSDATRSYVTYLLRGYEKMSAGDYEEAIREFSHAIRLNPDNDDDSKSEAIVGRGYARLMLGQYSLAIVNFDEAIRLDFNDVLVYYGRGVARHILRRYFGAIDDFDKAIRIEPNNARAYFGRGLARSKLNRTLPGWKNQPRKDFRTALRLATLADDQNLKADIEKALRQLKQ